MIKLKRLLASLIDIYLNTLIILLIVKFYISHIGYINTLFNQIVGIIALVVLLILIICKDCLFLGASIGKKIFKLSIYNQNNERLTSPKLLIRRNIYSLLEFPTYIWNICWDNKSAGDKIMNTHVVLNFNKKQ